MNDFEGCTVFIFQLQSNNSLSVKWLMSEMFVVKKMSIILQEKTKKTLTMEQGVQSWDSSSNSRIQARK